MSRARRALGWIWGLGREVADEWSKDRVGGLAAEIAFFALLGFFPSLIALTAALGSLDGILGENNAAEIKDWLVGQMIDVFGGDNNLEATVTDLFDDTNAGAITLGLLLAVYAATRGFVAVVRALDQAYDHEVNRDWLSTRLVGWLITVITVVVMAVVLTLVVVGPRIFSGNEIAEELGLAWFSWAWTWLRWPVVFVVVVSWAAAVYHIAPNHRSPLRAELPGAVLASIWWTAVSLGFGQYLEVASTSANAVFGLLGGALTLLFWLYLMSMGLLLGAEVNSIIAGRRGLLIESAPHRSWRERLWLGRGGPAPDGDAAGPASPGVADGAADPGERPDGPASERPERAGNLRP